MASTRPTRSVWSAEPARAEEASYLYNWPRAGADQRPLSDWQLSACLVTIQRRPSGRRLSSERPHARSCCAPFACVYGARLGAARLGRIEIFSGFHWAVFVSDCLGARLVSALGVFLLSDLRPALIQSDRLGGGTMTSAVAWRPERLERGRART